MNKLNTKMNILLWSCISISFVLISLLIMSIMSDISLTDEPIFCLFLMMWLLGIVNCVPILGTIAFIYKFKKEIKNEPVND